MGSSRIRRVVSMSLEDSTLLSLDEIANQDGSNRSRVVDDLARAELRRRNCNLPDVRQAWEDSQAGKTAKNRMRFASAAKLMVYDDGSGIIDAAESAAHKLWLAGAGEAELSAAERDGIRWLNKFIMRHPPTVGSEISVCLAGADLYASLSKLAETVESL